MQQDFSWITIGRKENRKAPIHPPPRFECLKPDPQNRIQTKHVIPCRCALGQC